MLIFLCAYIAGCVHSTADLHFVMPTKLPKGKALRVESAK